MTNRKTVLVVDDHAATREAYTAFLADCGYRVFQAAHGGEAILEIYQHHPDVVLLDIGMPVLDGIETAESLRSCPRTAHTRIIAMTGRDSSPELARMRAFCDDLFPKPCEPSMVEARIRSLLEVAA